MECNLKYCVSCLQPDTRPNDVFDEKGNCGACSNQVLIHNREWKRRQQILLELVANIKTATKKTATYNIKYDCIIGVSGGKDSTRQALWVRDRLGLKPLLVCLTYPPEHVANRGVENLSNLVELGFDVVMKGPAPGTWKELMKNGFLTFGNWAKSTELALYSSVPQVACALKIPYIFIGENQNFRDPLTKADEGWNYNSAMNQNTLQGGDITWIKDAGHSESNIQPYIYPFENEFLKEEIKIIDLGWFIDDWSNFDNSRIAILHGICIRTDEAEDIGDILKTSALDENFVTVNQLIKYLKFGFGKVSDQVNEDIRNGLITRSEGIHLIEQYDGKCSVNIIDDFISYLDISNDLFYSTLEKFINKDLFESQDGRKIVKKFKVGHGLI